MNPEKIIHLTVSRSEVTGTRDGVGCRMPTTVWVLPSKNGFKLFQSDDSPPAEASKMALFDGELPPTDGPDKFDCLSRLFVKVLGFFIQMDFFKIRPHVVLDISSDIREMFAGYEVALLRAALADAGARSVTVA